MKSFIYFSLFVIAVAAAADFEDLKDVDFKELLADDARRKAIFDCIMDQGPCAEDHKIYKDVVPEAIKSQCAKCTPESKAKFDENVKFLSETYPTEYNAVILKYAPKAAEQA